MTWGGSRPGSGRKPKEDSRRVLEGGRDRRKPGSAPGKVELIPAPTDLPAEQAAVWNDLAPHACAQRTLTAQTVQAFRDLCEAIVVKRAMLGRIQADGLTYQKVTVDGTGTEHVELKSHPLISQHRGMMQRVEAGMVRFRLAPVGKEIALPKKPADPFEEFDGQAVN